MFVQPGIAPAELVPHEVDKIRAEVDLMRHDPSSSSGYRLLAHPHGCLGASAPCEIVLGGGDESVALTIHRSMRRKRNSKTFTKAVVTRSVRSHRVLLVLDEIQQRPYGCTKKPGPDLGADFINPNAYYPMAWWIDFHPVMVVMCRKKAILIHLWDAVPCFSFFPGARW